MDFESFQEWEYYERNFKHESYFYISFGMEIEAENLSLLVQNTTQTAQKIKKYNLHEGELIYADKLAPSKYLKKSITEFYQHIQDEKVKGFYKLNFDSSSLFLPVRQLMLPNFFNNAEIIITDNHYPQQIQPHNLCRYFHKKLRHSIQHLRKIWKDFEKPRKISNQPFPYVNIYKHSSFSYYLLSYKDIPLKDVYFTPQCTFGIQISKAREFLDFIYDFYLHHTSSTTICKIYKECKNISDKIMIQREHWKVMKDYLFLFLYSYKTRDKRKIYPFLFRMLFSNIWEWYLGELGRDILFQLVQKGNDDKDFILYFKQVHNLEKTGKHPEELENMEESTLIIDSDRFFIEFRGLDFVLEKILDNIGNDNNVSVSNFLENEQKITEIFCNHFFSTQSTIKKRKKLKEIEILQSQEENISYLTMDIATEISKLKFSTRKEALQTLDNLIHKKTEYKEISDEIKSVITINQEQNYFYISF